MKSFLLIATSLTVLLTSLVLTMGLTAGHSSVAYKLAFSLFVGV